MPQACLWHDDAHLSGIALQCPADRRLQAIAERRLRLDSARGGGLGEIPIGGLKPTLRNA